MGQALHAPQIPDVLAGEDLAIGAPCHIDHGGLVRLSNATNADADAAVHGFAARNAKAGEPITLLGIGTRFHYAAGTLTPGTPLYLAAADGRLDDAPTVGDPTGIAFAVDDSDIVIKAYK